MSERIYILLPVHNRREITRLFVESLQAQTYSNYHMVLLDDGSSDGTEEMVRSIISSVTVLKGKGNWWWAGSLQQGFRWLRKHTPRQDDIVLIINDDTIFEPDFLEIALALLKDFKPKCLLLAQCYNKQNNQFRSAGVRVDWKTLTFQETSQLEEINCLPTRGLFLRVSDFFYTGGFHPLLLPHYLSDYEFTIRARRKGMKLMTDPRLRLWLDFTATGYRSLKNEPFISLFIKMFSVKSVSNPVYWSTFILLACPWRWKFNCWFSIWKQTLKTVYVSFKLSLKNVIGNKTTE